MAEESSIRYIKNWWKYQHYKDRTPTWIKLYRDIFEDPDIESLSDPDFKRLLKLWVRCSTREGSVNLALPTLWQRLGFAQATQGERFVERLEGKGLISKEDVRGTWREDASESLAQIHIQQSKSKNNTTIRGGDNPKLASPKPVPLWVQWKGQGDADGVSESRIRLCIHYLLHNNGWYKDKLNNFGFVRRNAKRMDEDTPRDYRVPKSAPKEPIPDPGCPKCHGTGQLKACFVKMDGQRAEQIVIPDCDCLKKETK